MIVGTQHTTRSGRLVKVVEYKDANNVTVEFEDGFRKVVANGNLKKGSVAHPEDSRVPEIGSRWNTLNFGWCTVVEYIHARNIIVEFDEPYKCRVRTENRSVKSGEIKNPMLPDERGFYFGQGDYHSKMKAYGAWGGIRKRIQNHDGRSPSYKDVTVCNDWLCYQNFAEWYYKQIGSEEDGWHIEKDLLHKGNKIYSAEHCVLVPVSINSSLTKRDIERGNTPIGVHQHKRDGKFYCQFTKDAKACYVGIFPTAESCFSAYKDAKEEYLKELAAKWRDKIDPRAYEALMNYTVEITD